MQRISVVGGGMAGLVAAVTAAREGAPVTLYEAHGMAGGRARSSRGEFVADLGGHAVYNDGDMYRWLKDNDLLPPTTRVKSRYIQFRHLGVVRRTPPLSLLNAWRLLRRRATDAPHDIAFLDWATGIAGEEAARLVADSCFFLFHHDPGSLSAAFVWGHLRRFLVANPSAEFSHGGWQSLVDALETRARLLGVDIELGTNIGASDVPQPPVIVATELRQAARILGTPGIAWPSGRSVHVDVGFRDPERGTDRVAAIDLDAPGYTSRYSKYDPSRAPAGHSLVQAWVGAAPEESTDEAARRVEALVESTYPGIGDREVWRRRYVNDGRSGAVDPVGTTWRDRPAIDRGDGVFLAGDGVAAPGLLAEVSWASAIEAANGAVRYAATTREVGRLTR